MTVNDLNRPEEHIKEIVKKYVAGFKDKEEALEYYREDPSIFESQLIEYIETKLKPIEELIAEAN
jgi:hypothetical protein